MRHPQIVKSFPGATVVRVERRFDTLDVHLELWDQAPAILVASDVGSSWDSGTWECGGLVRLRDLDDDGRIGFGIVSTEGDATLRFAAREVRMHDGSGHQVMLATVDSS